MIATVAAAHRRYDIFGDPNRQMEVDPDWGDLDGGERG
jgi:hypothetical protein